MKKRSVFSLFDNKKFNIVFSALLAVVFWFIVVTVISPSTTKVLYGVPVNLSVSGTAVEKLGLALTESSDQSIDITISGKRYGLSKVSAEDFDVSVSYSNVVEPGVYELRITPRYTGTQSDIVITDFTPRNITLTFKQVETREYPLEIDDSNIAAAEGYFRDISTAPIATVSVTAPVDILNTINKVVAKVEDDIAKQDLTKTTLFPAIIYPVDNKENIIEGESISLSEIETEITVPILVREDLPVIVMFTNMPADFATNPLSYTVEPAAINVAAAEAVLESMNEILISVDGSTLSPENNTFTVELNLPPSVTSTENMSEVKVSVDLSDYKSITLDVENFRLLKVPDDISAQIVTSERKAAKLVVPKAQSKAITKDNVYGEVDMSSKTYKSGQYTVPVTIRSSVTGQIWASEELTIIIKIE